MSFYCENCGYKNTEVQAAGEIQERGVKYTFIMDSLNDLDRQVVKSDTAVFRIENVDLEIPAGRGKLTNLQGILGEVLENLEHSQTARNQEEPEAFERIVVIIKALHKLLHGYNFPFTVTLNDPAGNSWIEPSTDDVTNKYMRKDYARTTEQNIALGLSQDAEAENIGSLPSSLEVVDEFTEGVDIKSGLLCTLPSQCPGCTKPTEMRVQMVDVPHFKQVIISALNCEECGYRTNDVKTGGEIPEKGQRITLQVKDLADLSRDILKSETCMLQVPECSVQVVPGTMGGRFTTVEGLLTQIRDDLQGSIFDVGDEDGSASDSIPQEKKKAWNSFFEKLGKAIRGEIKYTILLEDPLANSYVQSFHAPNPDPQILVEDYDRTMAEEEELGLLDMKTQMNAEGEYVKETKEVKPPMNVGNIVEVDSKDDEIDKEVKEPSDDNGIKEIATNQV